MSIKLGKISITNFKFIDSNEPTNFKLNEANLIILNGPNGYGKSTVFDAIELLITGDIKHFNSDLLNKGKLSKDVLANDNTKDIIIKGEFIDSNGSIIIINRIFECNNNFESKITCNDCKIIQKDLEKMFKINSNLFDIGMYVSQSESLDFLEQKYKNRKANIAGTLDISSVIRKKEQLKNYEEVLKDKIQKEIADENEVIGKLRNEKDALSNKIISIGEITKESKYECLFEAKGYPFDVEKIDTTVDYNSYEAPLLELRKFAGEYTLFVNFLKIKIIKEILELDNKKVKAIYYRNIIADIKPKIEVFRRIERMENLVKDQKIENIVSINELINTEQVKKTRTNNIVANYNICKQQINGNDKLKKELLNKRNSLWNEYTNDIKYSIWEENFCPLCGRKAENLKKIFEDTEETIEKNNSIIMVQLSEYEKEIKEYYQELLSRVKKSKEDNNITYSKYIELKDCMEVDISALASSISVLDEYKFISEDIVDINKYEQEKNIVINNLTGLRLELGKPLENEIMRRYEDLYNKFYKEIEIHSVDQINKKISYIAYMYSNDYSEKFKKIEQELNIKETKLENKIKNFQIAQNDISTFRSNYEKAYKAFQSKIVERIRIPLYLYSGKVIQTYPMGLGVEIKVDANQIVFRTEQKEDDIFNYFSMGQLNGVMLSILLSVRSTLDFSNGLDIILIDDPLQSIDDISAFSFADVLAESFSDSQIILSTHEQDKSNLLEFKFLQHGKKVKTYNMHDKYVRTDNKTTSY